MRIIRSIFVFFLVLLVFAAGFVAWLGLGHFEYQGSLEKEFKIDAPLSVVLTRAANAHQMPKGKSGCETRIDIEQATKNIVLGKPIELQVIHPELGEMTFTLQLHLSFENGTWSLSGETVDIQPNKIRKMGMTVAELKKIGFSVSLRPEGATVKEGFLSGVTPPSDGTTVLGFSSFTDLNVRFQELGFVRSAVDRAIAQSQTAMIEQIEKFVQLNLLADAPLSKPTPVSTAKKQISDGVDEVSSLLGWNTEEDADDEEAGDGEPDFSVLDLSPEELENEGAESVDEEKTP